MAEQPQQRTVHRLNPIQRRVFGVLIEKALTTPGGYPMTLNSLVVGCNQLTCREPVMQVTEGEVSRAVHELQIWAGAPLVRQAEVDRTARSNRFEHLAEQRFAWDKRQRAIMAELLLRGPQTAGELKSNASRMAGYDDLPMVLNIIDDLSRHDPPYVRELPRQPGRSTVRYDHLFYLDSEEEAQASAHTSSAAIAPPAAGPAAPRLVAGDADSLATRVSRLEADVAELRRQIADLHRGAQRAPDSSLPHGSDG